MSSSHTSGFSLNPSWYRSLGILATALAVFAGLTRYVIFDGADPMHCDALLERGSWLDSARKNWQPDGCMLHAYTEKEGSTCLGSRQLVFIGDSITRQLFFHVAHILDPALPTSPPDDEHKHLDYSMKTKYDTNVSFFWDPFLNASSTVEYLAPKFNTTRNTRDPALLVVGSGLWYLRYANSSGGIPAWEANMERILKILARGPTKPADHVVVLPVEQVITSKLSPEREANMHPWDIDAMNSDLFHRIAPREEVQRGFPPHRGPPPTPMSFPLVFNQMLDPSQTEDGLHFSESMIKMQASILLNLRCNDVLPKNFPLDKTCCSRYPVPSLLHFIVLVAAIGWGPFACYRAYDSASRLGKPFSLGEQEMPPLLMSVAVALIFLADRTGFWLKEQKQFNPWYFGTLCLASLAVGLITVKRADKDMGFLNRDQTDEWKGWMQIAILIYHYFGASKVSGIYNPIRVLVAAYLFMTGYGHTTFYLRKGDFGFLRIAQVMVRLNLLTILLAYTMNTDYISYYFAPLVSMWFLVIYATLALGSQLNDRAAFVICKIVLSAATMTWFMWQTWPLEILFGILNRFCGIHWSPREWTFRVTLDMWIVYAGMLASLAVIKIRDHRLMDHLYWPLAVKLASAASVIVMVWFFAFELYQPTKFAYNYWHPYISFLPVLAFVVLRNATVVLRSASSRAFGFVGKCSLETFIIQYHLWLAGDTKGVLLVLPGTRWRAVNFIITTTMFVYLSDRVAYATGEITSRICGKAPKLLPLPNTASTHTRPPVSTRTRNETELHSGEEVEISLTSPDVRKPNEQHFLPHEPDTPGRPRRWVDRLTDGAQSSTHTPGFRVWKERGWQPGLKIMLAVAAGVMWLLNMLWSYPLGGF